MKSKTVVHERLVDNLRRLMFERKMTQEKLAEASGIQRSSLSLILGGTDPKLSTLLKLAAALGVEPWSLLTDHTPAPEVATPPQDAVLQLLATLMTNRAQPMAPKPAVPAAAQEFLSYWSSLSSRDIQALMALARNLAANKAVDASYRTSVVNGD